MKTIELRWKRENNGIEGEEEEEEEEEEQEEEEDEEEGKQWN